jgi:hypothetical protein
MTTEATAALDPAKLDPDALLNIILKLPVRDITNISRTCKQLRSAVGNERCWRALTERDWGAVTGARYWLIAAPPCSARCSYSVHGRGECPLTTAAPTTFRYGGVGPGQANLKLIEHDFTMMAVCPQSGPHHSSWISVVALIST